MTDYFPPLVLMLVRWTLLLALAWGVQFMLRRKHARWRQILWRGVLVSGAAMAVLPLLKLPHVEIMIGQPPRVRDNMMAVAAEPAMKTSAAPTAVTASGEVAVAAAATPSATPMPVRPTSRLTYPLTLAQTLLLIWATGAALGAIRLMVHHRRLIRLRGGSLPADAGLASDLKAVRDSLNVRQPVEVRIARRNSSPFLCGMRRPLILVPAALSAGLSAEQRSALLAHEVAHVRRNDIFWCMAFRGATALLWFHPLMWKVAGAHELACEQEADRLAAGGEEKRGDYARLLAQVALRVLTIAPGEPRLALSMSSQIAGRVEYLKRPLSTAWRRRHTMAAAGMATGLFLAAAGCEFTTRGPIDVNAPIEFKKVEVVVKDEAGKPIEGVVITPNGFRVKGIHSADAYGWYAKRFGAPVPASTDVEGKAWVQYPVMGIPAEQELTGALILNVERAGYCRADVQTYYIDKPNNVVVMKRSGEIDVSAVFGAQRVPVTDLVVNMSGGRDADWEKRPDGQMMNTKVEPGDRVLQLMGKRDNGEIAFSAGRVVHVEREKTTREVVEMVPGIRVEGRIDASIPRPITNGVVFIGVRPPQFPVKEIVQEYYAAAEKYGYMYFWHTWRPINADGTFVFEAVPPGEADMTAVGDGFVSKSEGDFRNRMPDGSIEKQSAMEHGFVVPQAFALTAPRTSINLLAEPSATLEATVKTRGGKPVEDAAVYLNPNIIRLPGGLFGIMRGSSEAPYKVLDPLPLARFSAKTDKDGKATIRNFPGMGELLFLEHPDYQLELREPSRDRVVRMKFSPGVTTTANLTVESKGWSFIGLR
jgi:beta-lactamase regulating signal transducer with metallopeptidase domain